jgi:hypothetical protein
MHLNFLFVLKLILGCSKCAQMLYLHPEIILTLSTFLVFDIVHLFIALFES